MPTLELKTDYDLFDYESTSQPLTLEEAIRQAEALRALDKGHRLRVVPTDENQSSFRVEIVSSEKVYADFLAKMAGWWDNLIAHRLAR